MCLFCAFSAIAIISIFMDPLTRYGEKERIAAMNKKTGFDLIMATTRQMKNPYQLLMIPLTIFSGLEQGFLSTDFTQAFITCSWGVHNVGYVLICYGIVDSVLSISFGPLVRNYGRLPVYSLGAVINYSMVGTMLAWKPDADTPYVFFIIAGFWGAAVKFISNYLFIIILFIYLYLITGRGLADADKFSLRSPISCK